MTSGVRKFGCILLLCFVAGVVCEKKVFAFDKKASLALRHYIMGAMYEDLGNIDEAIQEYKKALKVDRKTSVIHLNLASSYIKKNDIPKAIEELNLAVELDPGAIEPHAILALLYSSQNKLDLAAKEYEIALKCASQLEPDNTEIYKSLGQIYLQQGKLLDAENTYKLILDLDPNDASAHYYLANIYNELNKDELVEQELKEALRLNPDYHEALNFLGYMYVDKNKNLDEARIMIEKALEFDPDSGAYRDSLGWFYFRKGKYKEAIVELESAAGLLDDPVIFDHLGDAYFRVKNMEKAKSNWEKSLELNSEQDKVRKKLEKIK